MPIYVYSLLEEKKVLCQLKVFNHVRNLEYRQEILDVKYL
jgi:hypothetical protein